MKSTGSGSSWQSFASGIYATSFGGTGTGGKTNDNDIGGNGGNGGPISITTNAGSQIVLQGSSTSGITAFSQGGAPGCDCKGDVANTQGASGTGGPVTVDHSGSISSTASTSIGITALSVGGNGGLNTGHGVGANPANSGSGGAVSVTLESGASINLTSGSAIGVLAASSVGLSINSPSSSSISGGPVTVTINPGASIASTGGGTFNIGVAVISTGSPDILEPFASSNVTANGSGYSGAVTVNNNGSITTNGQLAVGIAALSLGGAGVLTNASNGTSYLGNAGPNALNNAGGTVTVTNGGTIATDGASAFGIIAASNGAGGLINAASNATTSNGAWTSGVFVGAQNSSNNGSGGSVTVTNSGRITTGDNNGGGKAAIGIIAQSIGGGGGSAGGSGAAALVGDSGGSGGNGGTVTVNNQGGTIATLDDGAIGILAQSIGGGGGNGGNAAGIFVAAGGAGGSGGNGGTVNVTLSGGPVSGLSTTGDFAAGVVAQSVGGGGGNGGYAKSAGPFISSSVGGTGGSGGKGGTVTFTNGNQISTTGQEALGILAQSVGGGGGNGGAATAYSAGVAFSAAIALGGTGGGGGNGGAVTVNNNYTITTTGPDSIGIVAQSIAAGGGNGGAALAKSLPVGVTDIPTISFSTSLGASGGSGGGGGTVNLNNAGTVTTTGNGAHGILVQSIGAGGGNGGDSTAGADAIENDSPTIKLSVALGASGGVGGYGGTVTVVNGNTTACPGCVGLIQTGGQNAAGIAAQSIGGGGGASTAGQASAGSPNLGGDVGTALGLTMSLGASGGSGGTGGTVNVSSASNSFITTTGSGSPGILAQSIGGGGGYAGGGSAGASEDDLDINVAVGGNAGTGSYGGNVIVTNASPIKTTGGDSVGILAQSIGGGGGVAGSTDASASISTAGQVENVINVPGSNYSANVGIGGKGGSGGDANAISVTNSATIQTSGERAYGIEAQAIGGGGGNGGAATSTSNGSTNNTYSASVTVGGTGGAAGNGGTVTVTDSGTISTAGYNAHGILAQSIGGGGGVGGEGSVTSNTTIGLGAGVNGNGSASGIGGYVDVTTNTGGKITTLGDDAAGILAQSIGGGGGTATAGCTNSVSVKATSSNATACFGNTSISASTGGPANFSPGGDITLNVGGGASASGGGNPVNVTVNDAIITAGARSMGVIAQSIGGGGGYAAGAAQTLSGTSVAQSPGANSATGGTVTVNLNSSGSITTYGAGAWGILAQSVGGGGGFSGDPSLALAPLEANTLPQSGNGNAYANTVTVNVYGNITTTGANAHGIFAQAIGGSGGIVAGCCNSTSAMVLAGNTAQLFNEPNATYWGNGGTINITQGAGSTISTSGTGSIGIVAQSSGNNANVNPISVAISGKVIGGTNVGYTGGGVGAAGILLSGGGNSSGNHNTITVQPTGSVSTMDGVGGTAITTNYGLTNVSNAGTIAGSINLGSTPGTITNTGVLNTGATVVASTLTNSGTTNVVGAGAIGTTNLTGNFTQTSSGTFAVDVNSRASQKADTLIVSSIAQIGGSVVPTAVTLLPGPLTIVTANSLSSTATAQSSLLFNWSLAATNTSLSLSPSSDFTPAGVSLTSSAASLAGYLTRAWNNSDSLFAPAFGYLSQITNANAYAATLNAYSPQATQAQATALINAEGTVLGAPMSCPVFVDQGTLLGEDSCVWAKFIGGQTSQYVTTDTPGYQVAGTTYRVGAQHEIAPDWYFGGSLAAGLTWATENGGSSGHGQVFDGSVALKHTMGPWLFAGSFALATGAYHNNRLVSLPAVGTLPGVNTLLQSDSNIFLAGGRLRGAYDFAFDNWYIRPYGDLDVVYSNIPGFQESGQSGSALNMQSSSKTSVVVSPMVEFGGRYNIDATTIVRPYATVGMSVTPNNTRTMTASFVGAQPGDGTFQSFIKSPSVLGNFAVGVQIYRVGGFEVKAEYNLAAGSAYLAQSGSARVAYHF